MNKKTLTTLKKKYDEIDLGNFDLTYSEILFYPTLDALEFYLKKIKKVDVSNEYKQEFETLLKIATETYQLGQKILEENHNKERLKMIKEFFEKYSKTLIFGEEITF